MRLALLAVAAPLLFVQAAHGTTQGIGEKSCAHWQSSPARQAEGAAWVLGYWTGFDDMEQLAESSGKDLGEQGIIAAVKKTCESAPSMSLREATSRTYWEVRKRDAKRP
jgi:hypothetical protein